jgi:hypothetical protein
MDISFDSTHREGRRRGGGKSEIVYGSSGR